MDKGYSKKVNMFLRYIKEEDREQIDEYVLNSLIDSYTEIKDESEIPFYLDEVEDLTEEEMDLIRDYSGYNFRHINASLRGNWNYEENGNIDNQKNFLELGEKLREIIYKHPTSTGNLMVFRGVDLDYFKDYGITTLDELVSMKDKFMVDSGFVSTSLLEGQSFFKKDNDLGKNYNVKIKYLLPEEFTDAIYIGTNPNLTYSPKQYEYLINSGNLSKVTNVEITDDSAIITSVMVPKSLYDDYYKDMGNSEKSV